MKLAQVTLAVEDMLAADPADRRRTALALAAAALAPAGVIVVDHYDSVSYVFPGGRRLMVWHPVEVRDLIAAFYGGRDTVRPVTFGLMVPTEADVEAATASIQETGIAA